MAWSYEGLWIQLKEKGFPPSVLRNHLNISGVAVRQLRTNQPVTMKTLGKICQLLDCQIGDIVAYIPDSSVPNSLD